MRAFEIQPRVAIGPIHLGMSKAESREAMSLPYDTFEKVRGSGTLVDAYLDSAFQVFFAHGADVATSVELSSCELFRATINEFSVFDIPADVLVAQLARNAPFDPNDPELGYSYSFPALGLWLWRPTMPEHHGDEGSFFETVGIGLDANA